MILNDLKWTSRITQLKSSLVFLDEFPAAPAGKAGGSRISIRVLRVQNTEKSKTCGANLMFSPLLMLRRKAFHWSLYLHTMPAHRAGTNLEATPETTLRFAAIMYIPKLS